ncbi:MAG: murein biosynthesis integral membrane protein MurJ [Candidatus Dojkabacteria bacterium]|jgi:putative peptidoglycan lipid II flippase
MIDVAKKKNSIYVMMIILFLTKVLGLFKLRVISHLFGATHELDIFWAAFTIPDTLFMIIVAGSLNAAIIPLLADVFKKNGEKELNKFFINMMIIVSSVVLVIALLLFIFTPQITRFLMNSEFSQGILNISGRLQAEDFDLFVKLSRILMISPVLLGISTIVTGYLQVRRQFFVTSLAPLIYNIAMTIGPVILVGVFKMDVTGIAISAVLGSFLHFVVQVPSLGKYFTERTKMSFESLIKALQDTKIWRGLRLAIPKMLSTLGEQVNVVINTLISFSLEAGALSSYKYALSLYLFPVNIIGSAIAQAVLPELSENSDEPKKFKKILNDSLQQALFLVLPIVAILLVLRLPTVRLIFGVGKFDWQATLLTAWCLALLSVAIIGQTLSQIVLRGFYALKSTWLPLIAVGFGILVNIAFAFLLTNFFSHYYDWRPILEQIGVQISTANGNGLCSVIQSFFRDVFVWCTTRGTSEMAVGGLSLSLSISSLVELTLLLYILNKKIKVVSFKQTIKPMLTKLLNTALTTFGMYLVFRLFDFKLDTTRTISIIILTIATSSYGLLSYWLGSKVFEIKEIEFFEEKVVTLWNKLFKKA